MEIQVFQNENSSQTNAYSHYSNYSYSGLITNERTVGFKDGLRPAVCFDDDFHMCITDNKIKMNLKSYHKKTMYK